MTGLSMDRLQETLGRHEEQLNLLADLGQEFAQSIDIEKTLEGAVYRIANYMRAEAASVFLLERSSGKLVCRACAGPVNISGLALEMGQGIVGRTATEQMCQLIRDVQSDPDFTNTVDQNTGFVTRSMVCSPLKTADGVIGVLQVLNRNDGDLFTEDDRDTLRLLAAPTALAINNAELASNLLEQKSLRKELFMARRLQRSLLPPRRDPGYPIMGINLPARQVSGDFYDYFDLPDGRIAFTIGDVSGKGMNAALLMVQISSLLRWIGRSGLPPGQWLAKVNNEMVGTVTNGMFVCTLVGYFDPRDSTLQIANAGFPAPLVVYADGRQQRIPAKSPPVGILELDPIPEDTCDLTGGSLYMYSDGVSEIRREDGSMLGDDGFATLVEKYAERDVKSRLGAIIVTLRRMKVVDDTTLLVVEGKA